MFLRILQISSGQNNMSGIVMLVLFLAVVCLVVLALFLRKRKELQHVKTVYSNLYTNFIQIIDSAKDAFILFDDQEKFTHCNDTGIHFLSKTLGLSVSTHLDLPTILNVLKKYTDADLRFLISKNEKVEIDNLTVSIEGEELKNYYIRIKPIINNDETSYIYIIVRDITEDIATINRATEHEYILSEIMTYSRDGYIILDNEYSVKAVNQKALSFLRIDKKKMIGSSLLSLFPELEDSELITNCEISQIQKVPMEFDYFFKQFSTWYNIQIQPNENGLTLFFYENLQAKLINSFNRAEQFALEGFSKRDISFFQIMAKSIDMFQELFPGMFCSIYTLNEKESELKYFSSGYSTFLPAMPKTIQSDFPGFDLLIRNKITLKKTDEHFAFLTDLFSFKSFTNIIGQPIYAHDKVVGVVIMYFKNEIHDYSNVEGLQNKISLFIEKMFNYRTIFRELEKLSFVSENSKKAYATLNIDEQITWTNRSFSNVFLKSKEEILLKSISEIFDEKNTPVKDLVKILDSTSNFSNLNLTFPYTMNGNVSKQINLITHTIFSGDEIQLLFELEDITEQVNQERLLREKQNFLNKITNTVPIVLFQCQIEKNGIFTLPFISKEADRLGLGYTLNQISKRPELILNMIHPDDLPRIISAIEIAQRNLLTWTVEFRLITKKSEMLWIKGVGVHELTDNGTYVWNGYLENITEKKESSKEIENINARFMYASKAVSEVIWELDLLNRTMTWSDGLTTIFGYSKEFFPTLDNLPDFIHPDDYEKYTEDLEKNLSNKNKELFSTEYRFKRADGTYAFVIDKAFILRDDDGISQRIIGSIRDVSESILFEKRKKELINETQEFERNQFSMELHDGLAQQLVALNIYLSNIESELEPSQRQKIEMCKVIVLDSLNQTRTLCYNLSPPELSTGLLAGLKSLFDRLNVMNGINFQFNSDGSIYPEIFENMDIYNIYRIIQEFINNALKHSECTEISCFISFESRNNILTIRISDNGKGYDLGNVKFGFGIQNMHKRANLANAKIEMASVIGEGSSLVIYV